MTNRIYYYAHRMTVGEWLSLTGEHKLAFGISRSVEVPRKKHKPEHPQRYRGGTLYNYGDLPPRYPMPAIPLDVGPTQCRGLLGECIYCIWPVCEHKPNT